MVLFNKANLANTYTWKALGDDDPKMTAKPDSVLLNRHEGYEVLAFINRMLSTPDNWTGPVANPISTGQKIERLIRLAPSNLRSREHVREWVMKNWNAHG